MYIHHCQLQHHMIIVIELSRYAIEAKGSFA